MTPRSSSILKIALITPLVASSFGCARLGGGGVADEVEFADASFALGSAEDCEAAFSGAFLSRVASQRDWNGDDVAAVCAELAEVATTYVEDATLTTVTIAGVGTTQGDSLDTAYFVGASGYDLSAIRSWTEDALAATAVRRCVQDARQTTRDGGTVEGDFARDCLEFETGAPFPEPIFSERVSGVSIDEVGDSAAGLALGVALYNVPDQGTVASFVGGGFFAQAQPAYGAFIGCGAAIGFDQESEDAAGATLCLAAEYGP